MSFNRAILIGNLTRDPELRYTEKGKVVCQVSLAMNNKYTTAGGEQREEVTFVEVQVWGKQAESLQRYKKKGEQILVEGRLKQEQWQDKQTGQNRSKLFIRADKVTFIGGNNQGE